MAPLRHGLDTKATVFTWSITTDIRANLLSARFSKRAPAATRTLFSACFRGHYDTGVTELTDRICRVRRPVDIPAPPRPAAGGVADDAGIACANDAAICFGSYDANKAPAHNTVWIAREQRRRARRITESGDLA